MVLNNGWKLNIFQPPPSLQTVLRLPTTRTASAESLALAHPEREKGPWRAAPAKGWEMCLLNKSESIAQYHDLIMRMIQWWKWLDSHWWFENERSSKCWEDVDGLFDNEWLSRGGLKLRDDWKWLYGWCLTHDSSPEVASHLLIMVSNEMVDGGENSWRIRAI